MSKKNYKVTEKNGIPVVGEGIDFERIRRVTGYLVGTVDRFNDGKRAEVADRVKHSLDSHITNAENQKKDHLDSRKKTAHSSQIEQGRG